MLFHFILSVSLQECTQFGTHRNTRNSLGKCSSTSDNLVQTSEKKLTLESANTIPRIKKQTRNFSINYQEKETRSTSRATPSTRRQNGTIVSSWPSRPKSLMNTEMNKNKLAVTNSQKNNPLNGTTGLPLTEKRKAERVDNEVINGSFVATHLKHKSKLPAVLPKPKRYKGV